MNIWHLPYFYNNIRYLHDDEATFQITCRITMWTNSLLVRAITIQKQQKRTRTPIRAILCRLSNLSAYHQNRSEMVRGEWVRSESGRVSGSREWAADAEQYEKGIQFVQRVLARDQTLWSSGSGKQTLVYKLLGLWLDRLVALQQIAFEELCRDVRLIVLLNDDKINI